jgi:Papain family cysteine protease
MTRKKSHWFVQIFVTSVVYAVIFVLADSIGAQEVGPNTEPHATGLLMSEVEKGLSLAMATKLERSTIPVAPLDIWCPDEETCGKLRDDAAHVLGATPETRVLDRVANRFLQRKLPTLVSAWWRSQTTGRTVVVKDRSLRWFTLDGSNAFAVVENSTRRGVTTTVAEMVPIDPSRGTFQLVSLTVSFGTIADMIGDWRSLIDKSLVADKIRQHDEQRRSYVQKAELLADVVPISDTPFVGDASQRGMYTGLKTELADGQILAFDHGKTSCWDSVWSAVDRASTDGLVDGGCIKVTSIFDQFHGLNHIELNEASRSVDLFANGSVPAPGNQRKVSSCASWATIYVAYSNLVHRVKGAGLIPGDATPVVAYDPMHLHNLSKYTAVSAAVSLSPDRTSELAGLLDITASSTKRDGSADCFGGNQIPNVMRLVKDLEVRPLTGGAGPLNCADKLPNGSVPAEWRSSLPSNLVQLRAVNSDVDAVRAALAMGVPVIISAPTLLFDSAKPGRTFSAPATWRDKSSGVRWVESSNEAWKIRGGHAVAVVGFDNSSRTFKIQNSWGPTWNDGGYMTIAYDVFNEWTDGLAYYFDCVGNCDFPQKPGVAARFRLQADFTQYADDSSPADPKVEFRVNSKVVCILEAQDVNVLNGECPTFDLKPSDEVTVFLSEKNTRADTFIGALKYKSITRSANYKWDNYGITGTHSVEVGDRKEIRRLVAPALNQSPNENAADKKRIRSTTAPGRPGAVRKERQ